MFHLLVIVTLTLKNLTCFCIHAIIPFLTLHQYQYVVQPDTLNYGTIRTCLRKGRCISKRDYKGTTTAVERQWRQVFLKSFSWLVVLKIYAIQRYFSHIATWKREITNLWKFKWRVDENSCIIELILFQRVVSGTIYKLCKMYKPKWDVISVPTLNFNLHYF